jgi:hypothetical protein
MRVAATSISVNWNALALTLFGRSAFLVVAFFLWQWSFWQRVIAFSVGIILLQPLGMLNLRRNGRHHNSAAGKLLF